MGLAQELKQLKMASQRSRLVRRGKLPTLWRNSAVRNGTQHSVYTDAIVKQVIINRTDMALDDDDDDDDDDGVTEEELFVLGITWFTDDIK